ncbi:hypothetical protein M3Y98_01076000 [Aphelenchoides besseyi]|nr:hypothetical protein M3Y98_01076000 [Aphelenchoides besseyi]
MCCQHLKATFVLLLLLAECAFSCAATTPGTQNLCTTCGNLGVITTNALDQPVTQTQGTDPTSGCRTLTVFCAGTSATSDVILLWTLNGADQGSSTDGAATGSITRTLTCDANGRLLLTDNGFTGVVDTVECLSS